MRLKSVSISEYKNLKDFSIIFENDSFLDIFVGKNGTGKSNFFEALVDIFRHIREFDRKSDRIELDFDYKIAYELDGQSFLIEWVESQLKINGRLRKFFRNTPIPENILIYYSGHNDTITELVKYYETAFSRRIRSKGLGETRLFMGIGPEYKELLLSVILMQLEACHARRYICERLGIEVVGSTTTLTLKRPTHVKKIVDVDPFDEETFLWGLEGVARDFLNRLLNCIREEFTRGSLYERNLDQFVIKIDHDLFREEFQEMQAPELFRQFDNLKTLGMLEQLSIPIRLSNDKVASISFFSDGQFQSVYIYSIMELFKDRNSIILLDEPDSFLHPEWQFGFLQQVTDITGEDAAQKNHVLLSSHSASTITKSESEQIRLFEFDGDNVSVSRKDKGEIIKSLSAGLISLSEKEALISITEIIENSEGPVLFTEGISDRFILETAWEKLYPQEEKNFITIDTFGCSFLRALFNKQDIFTNVPDRKFFALFDFDTAYDEWNKLGSTEIIQENLDNGLVKKMNGREGYAMLLPVPQNETIRRQVINEDTGNHYRGNSQLTIEMLLYGADEVNEYFAENHSIPGNFIYFPDSRKVEFAKEIVPNLAPPQFESFRLIFEFIETTIANGQ